MAICSDQIDSQGLQVIHLENDVMAVSIVPAIGGKITGILDKRTNRNWLWRNPVLPLQKVAADSDYDRELDSGGWDEILFSVKPCEIDLTSGDRFAVPDHGDLVRRSWTIEEMTVDEAGPAVCKLSATGDVVPYYWRRSAELHAELPQLSLRYALENTGKQDLPFYWCAHPLLAIDTGMRVELPQGQSFRISVSDDSDLAWPFLPMSAGEPIDLGDCFQKQSRRFAAKIFVESATPGSISVCTSDRKERLSLDYDESDAPWIGMWVNNRGWSGCDSAPYLNLGIEPSSAPYDNINDAIANGWADPIAPGELKTWSLDIKLQA
jgi:galactose mutarotase-like enzyme